MNIKEFFKLIECRKSQATRVHAWYWTFRSLQSDSVQVKVTTYTNDGISIEQVAWEELEKSMGLIGMTYKHNRKKKLKKMGVGGKRK